MTVVPIPATTSRRMASTESTSASILSCAPKLASCSSITARIPAETMIGVRESSTTENGLVLPRAPAGASTTSGSENSGVKESARERGGLVMTATSSRPVSSASRSCGLNPSITRRVTSGHCCRVRAMQPGSSSGASVGEVPITTRPRGVSAIPCTCSLARATSRSILRAYSRKSRPAVVSRTPRGSRTRSGVPSSASSCCTCRVSAGCVTPSLCAVRVILPSSAICRKY